MAKKRFYRSDSRDFNPGDLIPPPGDHFSSLTQAQQDVETLIRNAQPNGQSVRADNIYAFEDCDIAQRYWVQQKNPPRHLYIIKADEDDILHIGDMDLYNQLVAFNQKPAQRDALVAQYWSRAPGNRPRMEVIVSKAIVVKRC